MNPLPYPSNLTDAEWRLLEPLPPPPQPGGRPVKYPRREIVNDILYILRTAAAWRLLPHDFPPYRIVFHYYRTWRKAGVWRQVNDALRQQLRHSEGRHPEPSAAIIDRPSLKTTEKGAARLRRRQKSTGAQASDRGRYGGAAGGSGASGGCAGSGRRPAGIGGTGGQDVAAAADLG